MRVFGWQETHVQLIARQIVRREIHGAIHAVPALARIDSKTPGTRCPPSGESS